MKSFKNVSDGLLLETTKSLVAEERKLTTSILWYLYEIQRRMLFAEQGYSSLFEYTVQGLGYSEAAASRRITAMRLLAELPELVFALKGKSRRECEKALAVIAPEESLRRRSASG